MCGEMTDDQAMREHECSEANRQARSRETTRSDFGECFPVQLLTNFSRAIEPERRRNYVKFSADCFVGRPDKNCA